MKAFVYSLASAIALVVTLAACVSGQAPAGNGRVLVLSNGNVLEGEVEQHGNMYVVRRPLGEMKIPLASAIKVCASLEDAYKFLCSRANLRDADEHLKLARWCQSHGLGQQAIVEARIATQMRPEHAESKSYLAMLEHTVSAASPAPAEETARAAQEPLHAVELTSDCLALFASKVQPILLNTCASCHAAGKGGPFVLSRGGDAGLQRTTQVNLAATVRQIAFDRPAASPLLQKACTIHGGAAVPPLAGPQAVPFGMLQEWVGLVIARNPQLKPQGAASAHTNPDTDKITEAPALSPFQAAAATAANTPVSEPPQPRTVPVEASVAGLTAPRSVGIELSPASPAAPARPLTADPASAENASPYDVKEFNTQWHPQSSGR